MKTHVSALLEMVVFLLCLAGASLARPAAAVTWTGGGDGVSWSDPHDWSGNAMPSAGSDVTIGVVSGNPTIQFSSTVGTAQINSRASGEPGNISGGTPQILTTFRSSRKTTFSGRTIRVRNNQRGGPSAATCAHPAGRRCGPCIASFLAFANPRPSFLRGKSFRFLHASIQSRP